MKAVKTQRRNFVQCEMGRRRGAQKERVVTKSVSTTVSALKDDVWLMMMKSNMQQTNNWMVKRSGGRICTNREVLIKDAFSWEVVNR